MTAIPPDILGAAAQAGLAAREVARGADADRVSQARAAARQVRALTDAADQVGTTDGDTAVFADAEGAGSQGRAPDDTAGEMKETTEPSAPLDAATGLDIQA
jgi:hypothetical protein